MSMLNFQGSLEPKDVFRDSEQSKQYDRQENPKLVKGFSLCHNKTRMAKIKRVCAALAAHVIIPSDSLHIVLGTS
jgi:hypothetical protein